MAGVRLGYRDSLVARWILSALGLHGFIQSGKGSCCLCLWCAGGSCGFIGVLRAGESSWNLMNTPITFAHIYIYIIYMGGPLRII